MYIIYLERIFALPAIQYKGSFLQKCINFVEQRLKFSHFEGSIIPQGVTAALLGKVPPGRFPNPNLNPNPGGNLLGGNLPGGGNFPITSSCLNFLLLLLNFTVDF